jgi:hypothetical protein
VEAEKLVISAEAFTFARTPREKELYDLMFADIAVNPMVCFRNKKYWLEIWAKQLARLGVLRPRNATFGTGIYDLSEESWLLDYDQIQKFFGPRGIYIDYDYVLECDGSVIPSFNRALGLSEATWPPSGDIFENRSN